MSSAPSGAGKSRRIGLLAPRSFHFYAYEVVEGMRTASIGARQRVLPVDLLYTRDDEIPSLLADCELDGLILGLDRARYERHARLLPEIPMINTHPDRLAPEIPTIAIQPRALAQASVDYFLGLGIRNLATVYASTTEAQRRVNRHLGELAPQNGGSFDNFELPGVGIVATYESRRTFPQIREFDEWLMGLEFPCGILTSGGYTAVTTARSALRLGLGLPDSLSVLSRSDDNVCLFASPPISSFRGVGPIVGELALKILIEHLNGAPLPRGGVSLTAPSIVERDSTGVPAGIDPSLRDAVRFIRRHALEGITVDDVLEAAPGVSRSQLYRSFEQHFGNTPAQEIQRLRLIEAKSQLRFTHKSLGEIADFCSFKTLAHFSTVFARDTGLSPSRWRAENQFLR